MRAEMLGVVLMVTGMALCKGEPVTLYRSEDLNRARRNIEKHEWARDAVQKRVSLSNRYMEMTPEELAALVPAKTPLVSGHCPTCNAHFASAELLDRGAALQCSGCDATWPCDTPERGEIWDVHGAMRSHRLRYVYLYIDSLGLAYALTRDAAYAKRAAAVLLAFAKAYPNYRVSRIHKNVWVDRPTDTWCGRIDGWLYREGLCVAKMLLAYDLVRDSGALSEQDCETIDHGLVRNALEYFSDYYGREGFLPCDGIQDHGPCWESLALAGALLDDRKTLETMATLLRDICRGDKQRVFFPEDGVFVQGTFSYASQLLSPLTRLTEVLRGRPGLDVYSDPVCQILQKAYTWPLHTTYPNGRPAAINDSHVGTGWSSLYSQIAYYRFGDETALQRLRESFGQGGTTGGNLFSVFHRPTEGLPAGKAKPYAVNSTLMRGVRLGILRQGVPKSRQTMAFLDYGRKLGHHHEDFLNIGLYAQDMLMLTEMGYRWSFRQWSRSPLAHNLVLELAAESPEDAAETVWYTGPGIQAVEAGTQALKARRFLALIETGRSHSYLADITWAKAGTQTHTWVMHTATDRTDVDGVELPPPADDQPIPAQAAHIVADPLRNVRSAKTGNRVSITWRFHENKALRTTLLAKANTIVTMALCPPEEDLCAKAFTSAGTRRPDAPLPYRAILQVKRPGPVSCFAACHEPFTHDAVLTGVETVSILAGQGVAFSVTFEHEGTQYKDIIVNARPGTENTDLSVAGLTLRGRAAVVRWRQNGDHTSAVGAILMNGQRLETDAVTLERETPGNATWRPDD